MHPKKVLDAVKDDVLDALPHCSLGREGRENGAYQRKFKVALKVNSDFEPSHYGKPEPYICWLNESESVTDPDYEKEIEKRGDRKLYDGDDEHKIFKGCLRRFDMLAEQTIQTFEDSGIPIAFAKLFSRLHPEHFFCRDEVVVSTELYKVFQADGASIGEPTPEGVHQDDQELVALTMVGRANVTGAESRIWDLRQPNGTLRDPWDTLIFLDRKVKHKALPFEPAISDLPCHRSIMLHAARQKYTNDIEEKVESMATMTNAAANSDSE